MSTLLTTPKKFYAIADITFKNVRDSEVLVAVDERCVEAVAKRVRDSELFTEEVVERINSVTWVDKVDSLPLVV